MKQPPINQQVYYRLIALWVVCEALLGGIIHGFKLPVSGLIVGSSAVICVSLIAYYVPNRGAILKATLIVAIFKMMLSPQSPLPAYFAVFFQGIIAEILFFKRINYRLSCLVFAILALLESSIQRILVMTVIYGSSIWQAFNDFVSGFTNQSSDYSGWLIGAYISGHLIVGLFVGWFASQLPSHLQKWSNEDLYFVDGRAIIQSRKKQKDFKWLLLVVWTLLIVALLQSYLELGQPWLPSNVSLKIFLRSIVIVLTWYFLLSPLLLHFLKKWLEQKKKTSHHAVETIVELLPSVKFIVIKSWQLSSSEKGIRRLSRFSKIVLLNTLKDA